MDLDSEVNTALDTIAEFSTLKNQYTQLPLQVEFNEDPDTESDVIQRSLRQWCKMNDLHNVCLEFSETQSNTVKKLYVIRNI